MLYVRAHYRSPIEFSVGLLAEAAESLDRLDRFMERVEPGEPDQGALDRFREAMDDDFGTPQAVRILFDLVREGNRLIDEDGEASAIAGAVAEIVGVLGLDDAEEAPRQSELLGDDEIDVLLAERNQARDEKRFEVADEIRERLSAAGVSIEDGPHGSRWVRK
jgi:cysteinyl-tRNA synthetase